MISVDKIPCICKVRIRYRQPLQDAYVTTMENGDVFCAFCRLSEEHTGQFAAFYVNDKLVASGVIKKLKKDMNIFKKIWYWNKNTWWYPLKNLKSIILLNYI